MQVHKPEADRGTYKNRGGEINRPTKIFYFNAYLFFVIFLCRPRITY